MLIALALTLLLVLTVLRRLLEPACPACSRKDWSSHPTQLHCQHCGWSNVVTVPVAAPVVEAPRQYELGFH
jgi:hypothetical protein